MRRAQTALLTFSPHPRCDLSSGTTGIQDGNRNTVQFGYDQVGNPNTKTYPMKDGYTFKFDADGDVIERIDGMGNVTQIGRLTGEMSSRLNLSGGTYNFGYG